MTVRSRARLPRRSAGRMGVALAALGLAAAGACTAPRDGEVGGWTVDGGAPDGDADRPLEDAARPADPHASVVLAGDRHAVTALLVFGNSLYWGEESGIYRIAPQGGAVELVATSRSVSALAAGGDDLFWIGRDDQGLAVFDLRLFPSAGSPVVVDRGNLLSLAATPNGQTVVYGLRGQDTVVARDGPAAMADRLFDGMALGSALAADPVRVFFVDTTPTERQVWRVKRGAPVEFRNLRLKSLPLDEPAATVRIFGGFLYYPVTGKFVRVHVDDGDAVDLPDPATDGETRFEVDEISLVASHPARDARTGVCSGTTFSKRAVGPAGSAQTITSIPTCAFAIALDAASIYWTDGTSIGRIPR